MRDGEGALIGRYSTQTPPYTQVWGNPFPFGDHPLTTFAIEKKRAVAALRAFSSPLVEAAPELHLEPLGQDVRARAREEYWGAVFPDGLAVVGPKSRLRNLVWADIDPQGEIHERKQL
jgi:hypothetical protein